ncbi:MAG: hypothetical protein ACKOZU_02965 [Planctomycetaceae bacterium]
MRTTFSFLARLALAASLAAVSVRSTTAQETIVLDDADVGGMAAAPGACGCRNAQSPPWHGSVAGDPCGPSCPPPNVFHADPCRQAWLKHNARQQGCVLPPHFPRMHGWLTDGRWPTPRPIMLPRCPRCGAHLEHAM